MENKMSKFLVTGGIGFLGTNLCFRLMQEGHKVIAMDNFFTGMHQNLEALQKEESFEFIEHDITKKLPLEKLKDVDGIFNLACPASPPHYQKDPLYTTKVSVYGIFNVLELANQNQIPIFHTSTSEVYGDPLEHPQQEAYRGNVNPIGIRACYDEGKRMAESILFDHHRQTGLGIRVVRIFNTYGPFMDPKDGRVVSNFIVQAINNQDMTIYGDGSQTRSFCYVDDLIEGFVRFYFSDPKITGPVNMGNPSEFTVKELAEKVTEITSYEAKLTYMDLPKDDPVKRRPNISLAKELFDWEPKVALEEGLKKCIPYFESFKK